MYRRFGKRVVDVAASLSLLVLLSPVLAIVALVVRLNLGRPVLFRQLRPGRGERPFVLLKFRTMTNAGEADGGPLSDAQRLSRVGRALRNWSVDELPELWNIAKGDMSLVGPRPLLMQYLPRYSPHQRRRHEVRPGLTGLAQVSGRNALTWERKFDLDVHYVDRYSLGLDIQILWRTFSAIVRRDGIARPGHATAPEFMGTPPP